MAKGTKYDQQFKENAVRYRQDHPELSLQKAAENLGISDSALKTWTRAVKEHEGSVPTRGAGNYSSDEAKEIARLQKELKDTEDALEIKKKPSVSWENDRGCLYCHNGVYRGNGAASGETPYLCQRGTETSWCFTIRLPCMEKKMPFCYGKTPRGNQRKNPKNLRGLAPEL